jgi:hypothetical protein
MYDVPSVCVTLRGGASPSDAMSRVIAARAQLDSSAAPLEPSSQGSAWASVSLTSCFAELDSSVSLRYLDEVAESGHAFAGRSGAVRSDERRGEQ